MGSMTCDREDCEHCCCDRYSDRYGYICWECYEELVESGDDTNIEEFMRSPKKYKNKEAAEARYNAIFRTSEDY